MKMVDGQPTVKTGLLNRLMIELAGADEETLQQCPQHDSDNVRAVAQIMICTWLYQTALFSIISHRLFAAPRQIRPELILASAFLASFILLIDSYMVMRSGWHLSGIQELKRGGIDISGGIGPRLKATIFLAIRIILSIGIAQLTAIFLSLLIFASDIDARLQQTYLHANAVLIGNATALVDGEIAQATDTVKTESVQESALVAQVTALRQDQVDPSANDPQVQLTEQEETQLLAQKAAADQLVQQSETFASNELGGIVGAPGNSGIPGDGPRRQAAVEAVSNAKDQDRQIEAELLATENRLGALRSQSLAQGQKAGQQSHTELPAFQNSLNVEDSKFTGMKNTLASLEDHRDDAIRAAVEAAPNFVPYDGGLLTQITVLDHIAHANPKITAVIILVDVTSFGFELAAVLAKVTSYVPTTYAALLARSAYLQVVRLVDEMMEELNSPAGRSDAGFQIIPPVTSRKEKRRDTSRPMAEADPFSVPSGPLSTSPKRRRGRPRKTPPMG